MSHKQCTLSYAYHVGNDNHGKNRSDSHTNSRILTKFPNFKTSRLIIKIIYAHLGTMIKKILKEVSSNLTKMIVKIKQWNKNVVKTLSVFLCTEQQLNILNGFIDFFSIYLLRSQQEVFKEHYFKYFLRFYVEYFDIIHYSLINCTIYLSK